MMTLCVHLVNERSQPDKLFDEIGGLLGLAAGDGPDRVKDAFADIDDLLEDLAQALTKVV